MPLMTRTRPEPTNDRADLEVELPTQPAKTDELLAAEAALAALIVERDQYENLRTAAIDQADVETLLRVDARNTVLPTLIDAAEVAALNARIAWIRTQWLPLFDNPIRQQVTAINDLAD